MKLMHVVPHIDQEAAGPSYSVPRLCEALSARGHDVELSCLAARGAIAGVRLDLHPQWPVPERFAISPSLARAMHHKSRDLDIVHNHSLWSMVNVAAGWMVPGRRAKLVTSPRGTLSPIALSRSRVLKRFLKPLQWRALTRADLLHATSEVEFQEIRAIGLDAPVAVIANGIDIPSPTDGTQKGGFRTLLYLGRIHPIKGLDRLLHAWQGLQDVHPDWRLVVAGLGDPNHVRDLIELTTALGLKRIEFPGALYGESKTRAYRQADLFVLPTHSENFGMVVAEALAHGCPAVVSHGAPWAGLIAEGCGWWARNDVSTLTRELDEAMRTPSPMLSEMGAKGVEWMRRDFSWESVAEKMESAYSWIVAGGVSVPPPFVRTL
ncbi:MAG: glycosyltransferase [Arenimonas sp.]|uniref:glycosyltransferase n=1 Tax=Arenimonas sp. TaxID=1872635 RepID=UPI0025C449C1|nr:glycosyltransferase [Arenimonas sp.]MBW8368911.1 glycosyltransferase [Arenimonas sp.]